MKALLLLASIVLCLGACGRRPLSSLCSHPLDSFSTHAQHEGLSVYARQCTHEEVVSHFSVGEDMYHYYYVLQLRILNESYVRYTLQSEGNSFFVPPDECLRRYTDAGSSGVGYFFAFLNAIILFPLYAISMVKAAVDAPAYLAHPDIVIPRSFGWLSLLYASAVFVPVITTMIWDNARSSTAFADAKKYILTQRREFSCAPFKTLDVLVFTPRAGFVSPCSVAFYNHKTHERETIAVPLRMVW